MQVSLTWHPPIVLGPKASFAKNFSRETFDKHVTDKPGIYIFARRHGKNLIPIYIGKAPKGLRKRLKQHLNNHNLIKALETHKSGSRILLVATVGAVTQSSIEKKVALAERAHIEYAMTSGYDLINVQGTKTPSSTVQIVGTKKHDHPFPRVMHVRRATHPPSAAKG